MITLILTRRQAACVLRAYRHRRRRWRQWVTRFCGSHPFCVWRYFRNRVTARLLRFRDWLGKEAKRSEGRGLTNFHMFVWVLAAMWLVVEALYLVDANFPFLKFDYLLQGLRQRHPMFELLMKHVRPVLVVVILAWLREMAHEWFTLRQDPARATLLIKIWLGFHSLIWAISRLVNHHFILTDSAQDTTNMLLVLLWAKWLSRSLHKPVPTGPLSPRAKKTQSIIRAALKALIRATK